MGFPETADIETSSSGYAARFSGAAGEWMLSVQRRGVLSLLGECAGRRVLEPGGGHAQLAPAMLSAGAEVTVLASSAQCAQRLAALSGSAGFKFEVGNLISFPYPDKSFDAVISVRFLSHCARWQEFVAETCRVARDCVIVDYPPLASFNFLTGSLFALKKRLEGNTRRYAVFSDKEIVNAFAANGYQPERCIRQFFFPMVLHRILGCPVISEILEKLAACLGLRALFGSPVLVKMVRKETASAHKSI